MLNNITIHPRIEEELSLLPDAFRDFTKEFQFLVAALIALGFCVVRADEANQIVDNPYDLYAELGHPSVLIDPANAYELRMALKSKTPNSPEYISAANNLLRANLQTQLRLIDLLEGFYEVHTPSSFYSQLIAQTEGLAGTYVKSQGSDVRVVMPASEWQSQLFHESNAEFSAFAFYLNKKIEDLQGEYAE